MSRQSNLERYKRALRDEKPAPQKDLWPPFDNPSARDYGKRVAWVYRDVGVTEEQALGMLERSGLTNKDREEFLAGFRQGGP